MLFVSKSTNDNQWPWQDIFYSFLLLEDQRRLKWCLTGAYQSRKIAFLSQMLPPLLLLPPEGMARQVLFNVWMGSMNGGRSLWLYLVSGTNLVENNGIVRDYDVIKCESYCAISQKKNFFFNFGSKSSAVDYMVAMSPKFLIS